MKGMNLFNSSTPQGVLPVRKFTGAEVIPISIGITSKGNQPKYKSKDGEYYVKRRFEYQQHLWHDNLVEVVASQYAYQCVLPPEVSVVRQGLCSLDFADCSYSEAFDLQGSYYLAFSRSLGDCLSALAQASRSANGYDWFCILRDFYVKYVDTDPTDYLVTMMLLDLVVLNEDRHLSNFGYLVTDNLNALRFSPLFDFGLGLFEHDTKYYENMPLDRALKKARLRPWDLKVAAALDLLERYFPDKVVTMLPSLVDLSVYKFPSPLSREYFKWINERLGVKVGNL